MKKYYLWLLLFILLTPFFVHAEKCDINKISIDDIKLKSLVGEAKELAKASANGMNINLNLSMNDIGDSIEYQMIIKNTSDKDYELDKNSLNISSDYIEYSFESEDKSSIIKANTDKRVDLKVEYVKEVPEDIFESGVYSDNKSMVVNLSFNENKIEEDIKDPKDELNHEAIEITNKQENPKTSVKSFFLLLICVLVISGIIFLYLIKYKKKKTIALLLAVLSIIPIYVYANCKIDIEVNSKVQIKRKEAFLITGKEFNTVIKQLSSNNMSVNYENQDENIKHFVWSDKLDQNFKAVEVNTSDSEYKVYVWYNDNTIYMHSLASKIYTNQDASSMFYYLAGALDIDVSRLDTSKSTLMNDMFWHCEKLPQIDLSTFDTSNVTNMFNMFSSCFKLKRLDLSNFNTSNTTSMGCMFWGNYENEEILVTNFDTSKVTEFGSMFSRCYKLTSLDLSSFSSESAENVSAFFYQDSKLAVVYATSSWNINNVSGYSTVFNQSLVKNFTFV